MKKLFIFLAISFVLLTVASHSYACITDGECGASQICQSHVCVDNLGNSENPSDWFNGIVSRFLNIIVWPLFIAFSILMFIWAGFLFVTAQGDPGKIGTAQKAVIWAVVGIIIAIVGYSAVNIITTIVNPAP